MPRMRPQMWHDALNRQGKKDRKAAREERRKIRARHRKVRRKGWSAL